MLSHPSLDPSVRRGRSQAPAASELVVIGASLGGLRALEVLLGAVPAGYPRAVVIAQHRLPDSSDRLAGLLRRYCALPVGEAQDKEAIRGGRVYLAPAEYHLLIEGSAFALSTEGPVSYARPSIDVLFETAADSFGKRVIAVVLTGANHDGARGAAAVQAAGGRVVVQDPSTAECPVMPRAALAATGAPHVLPLQEIGLFLANGIRGELPGQESAPRQ